MVQVETEIMCWSNPPCLAGKKQRIHSSGLNLSDTGCTFLLNLLALA